MRLLRVIVLFVACCVVVGCKEKKVQETPKVDKGLINRELINSYSDLAMQNAIITQHTLYPYHFKTGLSELNDLGLRDLAVMAEHFGDSPWKLNVRRDDTPLDLYQARLKAVKEMLTERGTDASRIAISDDMPGGSGMLTERVLTITSAFEAASGSRSSSGSSGGSMTGSTTSTGTSSSGSSGIIK